MPNHRTSVSGNRPTNVAPPTRASPWSAPLNFDVLPIPPPPLSILLFRTPVTASEGTDPYHDAFGSFCLPSFPMSAVESGTTTPLPPPINPSTLKGPSDRSGAELLKSALNFSAGGRRRGRWIEEDPVLTTSHLASKDDDEVDALHKLADLSGGSRLLTDTLLDDKMEFCVTSIPILTSQHVHLDELVEKMLNGVEMDLPQGSEEDKESRFKQKLRFRGVVITSQRAAEAWEKAAKMAAQRLVQEASDRGDSHTTPPFTAWPRTPFFAVGPATAAALKDLATALPTPFRPRLVLGGAATGSAEVLARYAVRHFGDQQPNLPDYSTPVAKDGSDSKYDGPAAIEPLLILTGDKNLPTIRDILSAAGKPSEDGQAPSTQPITFEELQVYETKEDPEFEAHIIDFEHTLPPVSSRPSSRRPSASEPESSGFGSGLKALTSSHNNSDGAPSPATLSAALTRAKNGDADVPEVDLNGKDPDSVSGSASVSRRPSIKAKLLAERLNALNKAAVASGIPSPLSQPTALASANSAENVRPPEGLSPQGKAHATSAFLQAANMQAAGKGNMIASILHSEQTSAQAGQSSMKPPPTPPLTDKMTLSPTGSGAVSPMSGVAQRTGTSGMVQGHEATLGTLNEDSALTDEALLEHAITARQQRSVKSHKPDWIVFFSPSGVQYALPHLRQRKWLPPEPPAGSQPPAIDVKPGVPKGYPKMAVLGPTTKRWVRDNLHFWPDACAGSPTPVDLKEAINFVEKRLRMEKIKKKLREHDPSKQEECTHN